MITRIPKDLACEKISFKVINMRIHSVLLSASTFFWKKIKTIVLGIFLIIYSTSFSQDFKESSYSNWVEKIQEKTFKDLKARFNLIPLGSGGAMRNGISQLSLSCVHYGTIAIDEGRRMILDVANTFLENINTEDELLPHLKPSPFGISNVKIFLVVKNQDGSVPSASNLNMLSISESKIVGRSCSGEYEYPIILEETYEEATSKLQSERKK